MKAIQFTYHIDYPGEPAAGLAAFTDEIIVTVASGDPCGPTDGDDSFQEHMLSALREWYDGAKVRLA